MSKDDTSKLEAYINESATWRDGQDYKHEVINTQLVELKQMLTETLDNTRKTNGRVTRLEDWSTQAKSMIEELVKSKKEIEDIKADINSKWTGIKWAGAVILVIGGVSATLYIKEVARDTVKQALSEYK